MRGNDVRHWVGHLFAQSRGRRVSNHWISSHEHVADFQPFLVVDMWEHSYLLDFAPSERKDDVEAVFLNVHWPVVDKRVELGLRR